MNGPTSRGTGWARVVVIGYHRRGWGRVIGDDGQVMWTGMAAQGNPTLVASRNRFQGWSLDRVGGLKLIVPTGSERMA